MRDRARRLGCVADDYRREGAIARRLDLAVMENGQPASLIPALVPALRERSVAMSDVMPLD
jgi:hypothetical protein